MARFRDDQRGDPPVRQAAALEEILTDLQSADPGVRADALDRLCPCRSNWDVPVQRYAAALRDDPSPPVRHRLHHLMDEDSGWGRKLEARRLREDLGSAEGEEVLPSPHSLAWKRPRRPLKKGAAARLALPPPKRHDRRNKDCR
jgi:hypothetical protein